MSHVGARTLLHTVRTLAPPDCDVDMGGKSTVRMDTLEVNTRTTRVSTTHKTVNTPRPKGKGRKAKGSDGALTLGSRLGCRVTP